mgnify:CR=1 FL=1
MTASLDATFCDMLTALMDKYEYGIEDVAQRANTGAFVVREWLCGRAVPAAHVRRDVLNSLDDPTVVPNRARGWLGVAPVFSLPYGVRA